MSTDAPSSPTAAVPPRPAAAGRPLSPSIVKLAWRQTWRDLRAGELRLLVVAVLLAVAALTAVGFFANRLNAGLARDAGALLGGDALVAADQPLPAAFEHQARALGLRVTRHAAFPSMALAPQAQGGATRLVAVKGVAEGYPLRGQVSVRESPDGPARAAEAIPEPGTAWVDAAVLDALQLRVGDELLLGDATLRIARVIALEPDRGAGFLSFAPRVMVRESDLAATNLIQPASRVTYRLAVAATGEGGAAVRRFIDWAQDEIRKGELRGVRVESLETGRPEMRQTLDRANKFLNLVALLAALLAAVAVAIAARDFAQRHLDDCALLRVLGLPQRAIASAYVLEFGAVGVLASALGVAAGWAVHFVFVLLLGSLVETSLPAPGWMPAAFGLGVGLTLLLGFGLPPVLQLARVPALRVIRRDVGQLKAASVAVLAAGALGFAGLLVAAASDLKVGLIAVGGFAVAVALFALCAWGTVVALRRAVPRARRAPRWLVLATRQVAARPGFAVLQVSALAVGLLALVLLVLLRTDLINSWRQATPPDAPNRFVINLQPDQAQPFRQLLDGAGVQGYDWYPMFRGRLVAINGRSIKGEEWSEERAQRLAEREFNLSFDAQMPRHNQLAGGQWTPNEPDAVSVEEGLAKTLGLKLGDRLRFDVAGQPHEARITSLRKVDWGSMRVNFFVMFPRERMDEVPATYISAFRAPAVPGFDNRLVREFPNVTNIDVSASLGQVQAVLDQVIRAVEFLFGFTLAAGLVVLFAAVTATREAREREYAVMRALGAGRALLQRVQRAELLGVGALAGFLASIAAVAVGWALAKYAFDFAWSGSWTVPLAGTAAGALLALAAGWWGLRGVLRRPVVQTLRRAAE
ncbi:ABC transporter permease [Azohydromonas lata]|uniref:FtsX-like permease family protein n=1 Tax=Azohydromonas lata TaxID=45677 RepID=A0ABU5IM25_9BURK|nr:FtsX-like permease family protein [Azohydromonas lata]MDZ5459966.1 FtsX-like permease family protein [Azohydromonas lata]